MTVLLKHAVWVDSDVLILMLIILKVCVGGIHPITESKEGVCTHKFRYGKFNVL